MWSWSQWIRRNGTRAIEAGVPSVQEALPRIVAEFQRARRYERTLTVAVFTIDGDAGEADRASANAVFMPAALASALRQAMRETDLVAWDRSTRRCIVVMPEVGAEEGERAVDRMYAQCRDRLACPRRAGVAAFPADGWTFEDLVDVAGQRDGATPRQAVERDERRPARVEPISVTANE